MLSASLLCCVLCCAVTYRKCRLPREVLQVATLLTKLLTDLLTEQLIAENLLSQLVARVKAEYVGTSPALHELFRRVSRWNCPFCRLCSRTPRPVGTVLCNR